MALLLMPGLVLLYAWYHISTALLVPMLQTATSHVYSQAKHFHPQSQGSLSCQLELAASQAPCRDGARLLHGQADSCDCKKGSL